MGKLIISDVDGQTSEYALQQERVTIGRKPVCDIQLNDRAVSGTHAVIVTLGEDSFIEDLGSTNGTQINGHGVSRHTLSHGDVINVGRNTLRYLRSGSVEDDDKTMVMPRPGATAGLGPAPQPRAASSGAGKPPPRGRLSVLSGPGKGREVELNKALTTIGKPGVQVAAITRREDGFYIAQVNSSAEARPILLNGQTLGGDARLLAAGDQIELMGAQLRFETLA